MGLDNGSCHHRKPLDPTIIHYVNILRLQLPNKAQELFPDCFTMKLITSWGIYWTIFKSDSSDPKVSMSPGESDSFAARHKQKAFMLRLW